jgi:hypothetical protein
LSPAGHLSSDKVDSRRRNPKLEAMNSTTSIAALLLLLASTAPPRPAVPPEALSETVQAHPSSAPSWLAKALEAWRGPWIVRPDRYDHRYITW